MALIKSGNKDKADSHSFVMCALELNKFEYNAFFQYERAECYKTNIV
jgi:hypothetical protein